MNSKRLTKKDKEMLKAFAFYIDLVKNKKRKNFTKYDWNLKGKVRVRKGV